MVLVGGQVTAFRSTVVKPYFVENPCDRLGLEGEYNQYPSVPLQVSAESRPIHSEKELVPSPTIDKMLQQCKDLSPRRSPRLAVTGNVSKQFIINGTNIETDSRLTSKELRDIELSKTLRAKGIIITSRGPFETAKRTEIEGLKEKGGFEFIPYDPVSMQGVRLFNSRLVNEVKGRTTSTPYEKSRMVIQAYNDEGKFEILTQSPTIQRMSQRLILALAPTLEGRCNLYLCDMTQAYVQSKSEINRKIFARPPKEIADTLPPGTIMRIIKPLYGIPEAGMH